MFRDFERWLGVQRTRTLIGLLVFTGLSSLVLRAAFPDESWSTSVQTLLVLVFAAGAVWLISGRLASDTRRRLLFAALPAMGAVLLGVLLPGLLQLFLGAALGWLIVAPLLMRSNEKREYKQAIKSMRRRDYDAAINIMNGLIKAEPKDANHYAFRAQLHRFNNNPNRARQDYQKIVKLAPESGIGQNGLSEIALQEGNLEEAAQWGREALTHRPDDWVAAYNLGLIADRQQDAEQAIFILSQALDTHVPDSRHRLLIQLWLARNHFRLGEHDKAEAALHQLRREKNGLREWKTILDSEEAAVTVRGMLREDIQQADALIRHEEKLTDVFA
jgi:predicted Zn-dependent protease